MTPNTPKVLPVFAATALLIACGGGGGGGGGGGAYSCAYIPGVVTSQSVGSVCSVCSTTNPEAVADSNQGSFASVQVGSGQRTTTITDTYSGPSFPSGSKVGALVTFLGGASVAGLTFNTSLDGVAKESVSGAALSSAATNGATPAQMFVFFNAALEFDSLQIVMNVTNGNEFRIFEFCGDS